MVKDVKKDTKQKKKRRKDLDVEDGGKTEVWKYIAFMALLCGGAIPTLLPVFDYLSEMWQSAPYQTLDVDSSQLSDVFFGGQPWLVFCQNKTDPIPHVWDLTTQAFYEMEDTAGIQLAVMPCAESLPSGKNVYDRFKLQPPETNAYVTKRPPHAFFVANGLKPKMIPQAMFGYAPTIHNAKKILDHVKKAVRPISGVINNNVDMTKKCLSRNQCVVVLNAGKLTDARQQIFQSLVLTHRLSSFVRLDTKKRKLSLEALLPELEGLDPHESTLKVVLIKRVKGDDGKITYKSKAMAAQFTEKNVAGFLTKFTTKVGDHLLDMTTVKKVIVAARGSGKPKAKKEKAPKKEKSPAGEKKSAAKASKEDNKQELTHDQIKARRTKRREQMEQEAKDSFAFVEEAREQDDDEEEDHDDFVDLDDEEEAEAEAEEEEEMGHEEI